MPGLGPLGANAATVRPPADADTYNGVQTWYRNCSSATAADGTIPTASWFNHFIAQIVYAAGQAGVAITNDQSSAQDDILWNIIQNSIAEVTGLTGPYGHSPYTPKTSIDRIFPNQGRDPSLNTTGFHTFIQDMIAGGFIEATQSASDPGAIGANLLWYKLDSGLAAGLAPAGDSGLYRRNGDDSGWALMSPSEVGGYWITSSGTNVGGGGSTVTNHAA